MNRCYRFPSDTNLQLAAIEVQRRGFTCRIEGDWLVAEMDAHDLIMFAGLGAWEDDTELEDSETD